MADLNDLQREWDSQPDYSEEKMNEIADLVRTRSGSMRSTLFARDMGEMIACIIVIVVFGGYWWFMELNAIAKTGIAITIAGAVEIMVVTQIVRRRGRADFTSVPLKDFLRSEVRMLNRQSSLLRHVAWWYLLPLYSGACVFVFGLFYKHGWEGRIVSSTFCVGYFLLCAFLWRLNQNARKKTLEPLRDAMQRAYDGLSSLDLESDPTHGLRPEE